jgi:hypothetical protein
MSTEIILNNSKSFIIENILQQKEAIKRGKNSSVILISGAPGIGKSDLMSQVAAETGMGLNPQYLGTMLLEQFGMPLPNLSGSSEFQKWSQPEFYSIDNLRIHPTDSKDPWIILFMDDIHLATKTIQTYFFQLLTYRSIHNKKMPNNFVMVSAGNRSVDRAGAQPIMAPIVNRFFILDVKAEASDWISNFAIPYGVRHDIVSFIEFYPQLLQSEPLESKPWASPRSWTYFSDALTQLESGYKEGDDISASTLLALASGHVGLEYASKFVEYKKLFCKWNAKIFFKGSPLPDMSTMSKIDSYTLMSAVIAELMKELRNNNYDVNTPCVSLYINVTRTLFDGLIQHCKEIIPLGLRTIIVSENFKNKQANVFYKLVQNNNQLLEAAKKILNVKK